MYTRKLRLRGYIKFADMIHTKNAPACVNISQIVNTLKEHQYVFNNHKNIHQSKTTIITKWHFARVIVLD